MTTKTDKGQSPQTTVSPRDVLKAYCQVLAWQRKSDESPTLIRPAIAEEFLGLPEQRIRDADLRGRCSNRHPAFEADVLDLLSWVEEEKIPIVISPTVQEFVAAVQEKVGLLTEVQAALNDINARVSRLHANVSIIAETKRHEIEDAKVRAGLAKQIADEESRQMKTRSGRQNLAFKAGVRQRAEVEAAAAGG